MKNHSQKGFSAVEAIIILVVVALLALGGWYVWKKNNKDNADTNKNTTSQQKEETKEEEKPVDPTEGWVTYSNEEGMFSFKHPASWVMPPNPEACTETLVLLAPSEASLGRCASESFGQIAISSHEGDVRNNFMFKESYYTDVKDEPVTVSGVTGHRYTTVVSGMEEEVVVGASPDNTKMVRYVFFANGRTYVADYAQTPNHPDVLNDFNLIVTKTLKFTK